MATLGDPTEVDRLALQIESLRAEISTLESHQKDVATIQSFNTKDLAKFKTGFRQEALKQAEIRRAELERLGVSHIVPPPNLKTKTTVSGQKIRGGRGGEWDAYTNLHPAEKARLRKNWMSETGHAPDQMALEMGVDSSDQAFETFLNHSRQIDLLEYYGKTGRMPKNYSGYGGKALDSSFLDHLSIDLRILHDSDLTPTQQLDYLKEQMIGTTESEIDRHLPNGLRPIEDAVSENYKLQDLHKAHVQAMNQHLSDMQDYELFTSSADEIFYSTRDMQDRKKDLAQRFKDEASKPKTQSEINREAAIARGRATKPTQSTLKAGKPVPQKTAQTQAKPTPKATMEDPKVMLYDDPRSMVYDNDYFDSLVDHGEYIDAGGSIPKDVFEILETADNTAIKAAVSSNKKVAVEGAEEAAIKVAKTVFESSRADKALSNLVSKAGRFNKAGPEALRLGALATTLGLGAGYAAGRRRRKR